MVVKRPNGGLGLSSITTVNQAPLSLLHTARRHVSIPIIAIEGITPENGGVLIEVSADLLTVIEGVFGQPDPKAAARRYTELFRTPIPGVKS